MTKYGWKDNEVQAEKVVTKEIEFTGTTISTAATGTAAYIPVTINGTQYYIEAKF